MFVHTVLRGVNKATKWEGVGLDCPTWAVSTLKTPYTITRRRITMCHQHKLKKKKRQKKKRRQTMWRRHQVVILFVADTRSCFRTLAVVSDYDCCWSLLYSTILRSRADSLHSHVILHEWIAFYGAFFNIHRSGVLTALAWLVPHKTAAISARSVYTIQPCTMSLHAKPHTQGACVFSCNLPPAQNDRGLLRATAVTRGWNGYRRNKSQHTTLTLEKKIFPLLLSARIRTCNLSIISPVL